MKRVLASIAAAGILVVGALAVTGITASDATAQEDESATELPSHPRLTTALDELVADGVLTQDQADAVIAKLEETFEGDRPFRRGFVRGFRFANGLDTVTEVIGIDADELAAQLRDGATIAEVAEANGVDPQAVIDAMVADATDAIQAAVDAGRIDQAEADERLAELEERITDMVNGEHRIHPRQGRFGATDEETGLGA